MKKTLLFLGLTLIAFIGIGFNTESYSKDIMPVRPNINQVQTYGLYQIGNDTQIYKEPNDEAQILYRVRWNDEEFVPEEVSMDNFFVVFLPKKSLALVAVTDITDEWVEIIYDNSNGKKGWIKLDDPYKFMTWINFYNSYGKKYGLKMLGGAPEYCKDIKSSTEEKSQTLSTINHPEKINLNVLRGNWALVSVMDIDRMPKTGYIKWRGNNGIRYFFPDIK